MDILSVVGMYVHLVVAADPEFFCYLQNSGLSLCLQTVPILTSYSHLPVISENCGIRVYLFCFSHLNFWYIIPPYPPKNSILDNEVSQPPRNILHIHSKINFLLCSTDIPLTVPLHPPCHRRLVFHCNIDEMPFL